jgi:DNA polymerase V
MRLFLPTENPPPRTAPFFNFRVQAGFPSPAQDYTEKRIDLYELLIKHPESTYYVRAEGDSMFPDISEGDLLVVDRAAEHTNGSIVLACINNEFCVKRFYKRPDGGVELISSNPEYGPVNLPDEGDFEIFGKVIGTIKQFK